MCRQPLHQGAHWVPELRWKRFLAWCRWSGTFHQSRRGRVFFGRDFHVATRHRGDAAYMGAVDKMAEEGGAEVAAGVETGQDKVWIASLAAFLGTYT